MFFYSAGTLLNFLGAVALGAPVKFQYVKVVISEYSVFFFPQNNSPHGGRS